MSSSALPPSPDDDYASRPNMLLNRDVWDATLTSVGARIRALEAIKGDWEALIAEGTGQALAVIQANVGPQITSLTAVIAQLKADVALAEDAIATIVSGGIGMSQVSGLSAALALKASTIYVDSAIAALKGDVPEAYDTLVEIAAKLAGDNNAIAGLLTTIATKANKATKLKVGPALSIDGVAGTEVTPAEADLSADRLIRLVMASTADTIAGADDTKPAHSAGVHAAIAAALAGSTAAIRVFTASGTYTPTPGTKRALVFVTGGGGGGYYTGSGGTMTGGSGAATAIALIEDPVTTVVTVGAAGANAADGGTSSFGSLVTAAGGLKGNQLTNPPLNGPAGGSVTTGANIAIRGGSAPDAVTAGMRFPGGSSFWGGGGSLSAVGAPGSGGQGYANPGNSAAGIVIVMEYGA